MTLRESRTANLLFLPAHSSQPGEQQVVKYVFCPSQRLPSSLHLNRIRILIFFSFSPIYIALHSTGSLIVLFFLKSSTLDRFSFATLNAHCHPLFYTAPYTVSIYLSISFSTTLSFCPSFLLFVLFLSPTPIHLHRHSSHTPFILSFAISQDLSHTPSTECSAARIETLSVLYAHPAIMPVRAVPHNRQDSIFNPPYLMKNISHISLF